MVVLHVPFTAVLQVAPAWTVNVPLLHVNEAEPEVGNVLSVTPAVPLCAVVPDVVALQVDDDTVQLTAWDGQVAYALAEHDAVEPPFDPLHVHVHGPVPATADADPAEHNPLAGALAAVVPFDAPQAPSVFNGAEHDAFVPPPEPLHDQVKGPDPDTAVAVPKPHNPDAGAVYAPTPLAAPHVPLNAGVESGAEQEAFAEYETRGTINEARSNINKRGFLELDINIISSLLSIFNYWYLSSGR